MPKIMTATAARSPLNLPLKELETAHPLVADAADIELYPELEIAFIEGNPFHAHDIHEVYLALVQACTAVHTRTPESRSWETPLGIIEAARGGLNIFINGIAHTPMTVDVYCQALQPLVEDDHSRP